MVKEFIASLQPLWWSGSSHSLSPVNPHPCGTISTFDLQCFWFIYRIEDSRSIAEDQISSETLIVVVLIAIYDLFVFRLERRVQYLALYPDLAPLLQFPALYNPPSLIWLTTNNKKRVERWVTVSDWGEKEKRQYTGLDLWFHYWGPFGINLWFTFDLWLCNFIWMCTSILILIYLELISDHSYSLLSVISLG